MSVVAKYWIIFVLAQFGRLKKGHFAPYVSSLSSLVLFLAKYFFVDAPYVYQATV